MAEVKAFPLCWPPGWKRTQVFQRKRAQFKGRAGKWVPRNDGSGGANWQGSERLTLGNGIERVRRELRALGVRQEDIIISSDLKLRIDGEPFASQAWAKLDQGVAVYWTVKKVQRCMAIDHYDRLPDNLAAIAATLEAMRAIERHGGATILDRAFTGFLALPAPAQQDLPHEVLGVDENATEAEIVYAYRRLATQCHPDAPGGSNDAMSRINTARDAMLAARKAQ